MDLTGRPQQPPTCSSKERGLQSEVQVDLQLGRLFVHGLTDESGHETLMPWASGDGGRRDCCSVRRSRYNP